MYSPFFHLLIWVGDTFNFRASSFWLQPNVFRANHCVNRILVHVTDPALCDLVNYYLKLLNICNCASGISKIAWSGKSFVKKAPNSIQVKSTVWV